MSTPSPTLGAGGRTFDLAAVNAELHGADPGAIIDWALRQGERPVVTTNFRPYEVALLAAVAERSPQLPVIWCDTGYNTPQTYRHAEEIIARLALNVHRYVPRRTAAHRDATIGIPEVDTEAHDAFTHEVKLEPFGRAMAEHRPDVWFTNLRRGQTALRDTLDIVSRGSDGVLKVSPFYAWSDADLDAYLAERDLPNEHRYFDPTKVLANRECGLHT